MTEQEKSSAVVEETREAVETTSQPVNTEKKSKNSTALILSAVAIAIALAAGVGLYGWGKQQATTQTATSDALANQLTALQKAQESQKAELEGIIKQQATQLDEAARQQAALVKQLDEVQQKVATISGSDAGTWLLAQADFLVKLAGRKLWSDQDVTTAAALAEIPTTTPASDALSKALKKRGFKFVGSTICYSFMQACGLVNDHVTGCFCRSGGQDDPQLGR